MTTQRASGNEDGGRVGAILGAVLAHPGDHLLHVDERIGKLVIGGTAVVRADAYPALAGEPVEQVARSETLATEDRVEVDEHWTTSPADAMTARPSPIQSQSESTPLWSIARAVEATSTRKVRSGQLSQRPKT